MTTAEAREVLSANETPVADTVIRPAQWRGLEAVASIAHDMRAPLATITTSAELLEQDLAADDSAHLVSVIQRQAFRLQQMIQDLAEYINIPSAGIKLRPEVIDLSEALREVGAEFQRFKMTHRLTIEAPAAPVLAQADPEKIRRIVQNLLGNAFQYTPRGSNVSARIRLDSANPAQAVLEVEDEGPGVPAAQREEVFRPFVRLGGQGSGQGLGLYIVSCLAEAHGGHAWVEEGVSGGARFCVSLPILTTAAG
jgi:signal transduction histidine kinase